MDPLLVLLAAGGVTAGVFYLFHRDARISAQWQMDVWRQVAEEIGLTETEVKWTGVFGPTTLLKGRLRVLEVGLWTQMRGKPVDDPKPGYTALSNVILVQGMGHRPGDLAIHPETLGTSVGKALGAKEIELGDYGFDENVYLRGSAPLAFALMDRETRRRLVGLFLWTDATVSLKDGALRVEIPDTLAAPRWLAERVAAVLDVAQRLSRPADLASRLAANVGGDPIADVRLRNLKVLVREYPGRPATLSALRAALRDPSVQVRVHAAMALGEGGHDTLLAIASAEDGDLEAALAIDALGGRLPLERVKTILAHALRTRRLQVARACLESLGRRRVTESVEPLAKVLAIEKGTLAETAARALGMTARPEAEPPLIDTLERGGERLKLAAALALGRVGSAAAVAPLRRLEATSPEGGLRRAAREAIAEIQERLSGASPGQLSLAAGETGQLSLTEDEAGRVSLSAEDGSAAKGSERDQD
jgi:HEAT repeat protein